MTARLAAVVGTVLALAALGPVAHAAPDGRSAGAGDGQAQAPRAQAQARDGHAHAGLTQAQPADSRARDGDRGSGHEAGAASSQAAQEAERRSPGKPTAPISIDHDWLELPALGRELAVRISVGSSRALGDVTIRLDGGDGLVVDAAWAETRVGALAPDETHTFEPAVLVATPGRHYLAVSVTAVIDGAAQTRSVAVPVRLGGETAAAAPELGDGAADDAEDGAKDTDRVRSLPAEERVDRR